MLSIRNAGINDIPLIRELCFKVWPQTYSSLLSKEQLEYMLELMYSEKSLAKQMTEDGFPFIIVNDGDEPVGFASFGEIEKNIYKLQKLYVLPNQQGKGTGKFVIDYIIDKIKSAGATALRLQVFRKNKAKAFYEKLGFTVILEFKFDIGHGYVMDDYLMEKKLL
jgi:diamine N-acetyltransferase